MMTRFQQAPLLGTSTRDFTSSANYWEASSEKKVPGRPPESGRQQGPPFVPRKEQVQIQGRVCRFRGQSHRSFLYEKNNTWTRFSKHLSSDFEQFRVILSQFKALLETSHPSH